MLVDVPRMVRAPQKPAAQFRQVRLPTMPPSMVSTTTGSGLIERVLAQDAQLEGDDTDLMARWDHSLPASYEVDL